MKYIKLQIFMIILMIMGTCSGACAIAVQDNNDVGLDEVKTIYVANNGTDRNDGLTPEKPKRNIENAIKVAKSGDTIILAPGTY